MTCANRKSIYPYLSQLIVREPVSKLFLLFFDPEVEGFRIIEVSKPESL
jgi:hypothetical protein